MGVGVADGFDRFTVAAHRAVDMLDDVSLGGDERVRLNREHLRLVALKDRPRLGVLGEAAHGPMATGHWFGICGEVVHTDALS